MSTDMYTFKKVFSYCIYGNKKKYCQGLLENIQIIVKEFPNFEIWIHKGTDVPNSYIEQYKSYSAVRIFETSQNGASLMCNRFFSIDHPECELMIVRDADSRVHFRDQWCIREFLASDKSFHVIRDHYWHKTKITGGTWAMKKSAISLKIKDLYNSWIQGHLDIKDTYDTDQKFIEQCLYPLIKDSLIVHSNIVGFEGETITPILSENNNLDFVCNVIDYDASGNPFYKFRYDNYPIEQHIYWLYTQRQYRLIHYILKEYDIYKIPEKGTSGRSFVTRLWLDSVKALKLYDEFLPIMKIFHNTNVDDYVIHLTNGILQEYKKIGKVIVGSTILSYEPQENEYVIYYGAFLHDVNCLPITNKIYRNAIYFNTIQHDKVIYDSCWESFDYIYVLNLEDRTDRYLEIMCELCKMNAPLNRVYHYKAKKEAITKNKLLNSYLGATKNHLDVTKHFIKNSTRGYCLVLEDDVMFTSRYDKHKADLTEFVKRSYDFDICFTSCSKFGEYKEYDDILTKTRQVCTTTAGYILCKNTANNVLACFQDGYDKMLATGDYSRYVCDRYWDLLRARDKMFLFKTKFGFQRPSFSSIESRYRCNFD